MNPNSNSFFIQNGQTQDTLHIYGEHLCQRVADRAMGKKKLHK